MDAADAWARYWSTGRTHSCFSGGAPFDCAERWTGFFDTLTGGARIIDLACGGGALTRQAAAHGKAFAVTGVDFAQSAPEIAGADVRPGVSLEALAFPDAAFDAAVSQFGLEYADLDRAVPEAARVLTPGGRFGFLTHHAGSAVSRGAAERRARLDPLLADGGPVRKAVRLGAARAAGEHRPDLLDSIAADFAAARSVKLDEATAWAYGFLAEIMNKHMQFPPAYLDENARTLLAELEAMALRLDQMLAAARSADDIEALSARLSASGCALEVQETVRDTRGDIVAWWLQGVRRQG
ncbi:MAG: class I SAM-dependent methyltransferase [Oceanicaulis sp.]